MDFSDITGFDWDADNVYKNITKHNVYDAEAEQVFFNRPLIVKRDVRHSQNEDRYFVLGRTNHERLLFVSFTIRSKNIRVISVRDMTKREECMKTTKKEIPEFQNEEEEREFWGKHDSVDYINWEEGEIGRFPKLKPNTKSISIRLPETLIEDLKILAHKRDVPYQSLLKVYLAERVAAEFGGKKVG